MDANQGQLFETGHDLPERYRRIYADMERQGITVPQTPAQYCDLCGVECDCLLMLENPAGDGEADLIDLCGECPQSREFLNRFYSE